MVHNTETNMWLNLTCVFNSFSELVFISEKRWSNQEWDESDLQIDGFTLIALNNPKLIQHLLGIAFCNSSLDAFCNLTIFNLLYIYFAKM